MDIMKMARDIGKEIQKDERYISMSVAQQACDADAELQKQIGEFNLKRMAINHEAEKEDRDEEVIKNLNTEFRKVYADIMRNENMARYNMAKNNFDTMYSELLGILELCANGEDPDTCEYKPSSGCSAEGCSGCSGCG